MSTAINRRPRVAFTFGSIARLTTARRRFRCQSHLASGQHYIEPGQRYVRNALPPNNPDEHDPRQAEHEVTA